MNRRTRAAMMAQCCRAAAELRQTAPRGMIYLAEHRKRAGISQVKLAERLYVSTGVVFAWEHQRSWPHSSLLPMLAETLHITVEELYLPPEEADG